ncbi:MAG: hypothetical protein ACI93T_001563, partial [Porticoccaceae bacterium]
MTRGFETVPIVGCRERNPAFSKVTAMFRVSKFALIITLAAATAGLIPESARAAGSRSSSQTIGYVLPRMVKIFGAGGLQGLAAFGSGFLVSKEGHIVTVWSHV